MTNYIGSHGHIMGSIAITTSKSVTGLLAMEIPPLRPESIGDSWFTKTLATFLLVVGIIILLAVIIRVFCIPRWRKNQKPSALQLLTESFVELFEKEGLDTVGKKDTSYLAPWYFGCCALILFGTLSELFGLRPPLTDLNVTLMLGLSTYVFMWYCGLKEQKWRYFKRSYLLVTDAVVPFSMALRLFASVFSGYVISELLRNLMGAYYIFAAPVSSVVTTLFHALIQTYVFMMLSYVFIADAKE